MGKKSAGEGRQRRVRSLDFVKCPAWVEEKREQVPRYGRSFEYHYRFREKKQNSGQLENIGSAWVWMLIDLLVLEKYYTTCF